MAGEICLFCKINSAEDKFLIQKSMYDPKSRRGGHFGQMLVYDIIKINIPRCKKCAGIHKSINNFAALYTVLLVVIPIIAGFLGYLIEIRYDILNLSMYFAIGAFVIWLLLLIPLFKAKKAKISKITPYIPVLSDLPVIQEWKLKGWIIGNPPPN